MIESVATKCSLKEVFPKNFEISQENTGDRVFFFDKVAVPQKATLIKMRLKHICFSVSFIKFLRTPILQKICKRLVL